MFMANPVKLTLSLLLGVGIFLAGYAVRRPSGPPASANSARRAQNYVCPMHPQYKSDRPGECPACGMTLVPASASDVAVQPDSAPAGAAGSVSINAARQQLTGVRAEEVRRAPFSYPLRAFGRVAVDEVRLYRLVAPSEGWIREIGPNPAGTFVKKGEILASYYVKDLLSAQQTFLYALVVNNQPEPKDNSIGPQRPPTTLSVQVGIDTLRNLGMSDLQIEEMRKTRTAARLINIYSPADGFVIARNVSPGQWFDKGSETYRIADLSHVWIMTDVFEKDRELIRPGVVATVRYQGREFNARLSDALPQFDPQSRTLKTRFELDNPGLYLRPDMFVDVEMRISMPPAVTVDADAILDSGRQKTVFIDRGTGMYQPRAVETGWRLGDRIQILSGLQPGERVVVSGNFQIDSESRMIMGRTAAAPPTASPAAAEKDPVCGMDVDPKSSGARQVHVGGKVYYFCSDKCKTDFEASPAKYLPKTAPVASAAPAAGPV